MSDITIEYWNIIVKIDWSIPEEKLSKVFISHVEKIVFQKHAEYVKKIVDLNRSDIQRLFSIIQDYKEENDRLKNTSKKKFLFF